MELASTVVGDHEIEQVFETLCFSFTVGSQERHELCFSCGRKLHMIVYDEWRRIGMGCGWNPRDPARRSDYRRLFDNLVDVHRYSCDPDSKHNNPWRVSKADALVFGNQITW